MSKPGTIEELPYDPEFERLSNQVNRNLMWFSEHAVELEVFKKFRGRYVASAGDLLDRALLVMIVPVSRKGCTLNSRGRII